MAEAAPVGINVYDGFKGLARKQDIAGIGLAVALILQVSDKADFSKFGPVPALCNLPPGLAARRPGKTVPPRPAHTGTAPAPEVNKGDGHSKGPIQIHSDTEMEEDIETVDRVKASGPSLSATSGKDNTCDGINNAETGIGGSEVASPS